MPIEWSTELTTGVERIDNQHKELINRINKLQGASREGKGKEVIDELMVFLEDYIKSHYYIPLASDLFQSLRQTNCSGGGGSTILQNLTDPAGYTCGRDSNRR